MSDLPQRKPLTQDEVYQLLRECVTVVKTGETLVIQVGDGWYPEQIRQIQEALNCADENGPYWPFRTLVVPGERLGVAEPAEIVVKHEVTGLPDAEFAKQLHRVMKRDRNVNPRTIS